MGAHFHIDNLQQLSEEKILSILNNESINTIAATLNGISHKDQVKFMVGNTLKVDMSNYKHDATDALAAALCHEQQFRYGDL